MDNPISAFEWLLSHLWRRHPVTLKGLQGVPVADTLFYQLALLETGTAGRSLSTTSRTTASARSTTRTSRSTRFSRFAHSQQRWYKPDEEIFGTLFTMDKKARLQMNIEYIRHDNLSSFR